MPSNWTNSSRRDRLPSDWPRIRGRILRRDKKLCQWRMPDGDKCLAPATDVDHIRAGDDHRDNNLQSLCSMHHRRKSSSEGGTARGAARRKVAARFRRVEEHPGMM